MFVCVCVQKLKHCDIILNGWDDNACFLLFDVFYRRYKGQINSLDGTCNSAIQSSRIRGMESERSCNRTKDH